MKKILPTILIVSAMIVLLSLMTITYADIEQASNQATGNLSTAYSHVPLCFSFWYVNGI